MRVKLEDVCERGTSSLMQKDIVDKNGKYPVYGASGRIGSMETYQQEHQTVAVVKDGAGIGRTMLLPEKSSIIGTMQYLIPKNCIEPEYLYYAVKYMHLEKYFSGATIPHIYFRDYKTEEFNLHNKTEQQEIISTLKRVEAVISNRREQLAMLDELVKARFVEMFGDKNYHYESLINLILDGTSLSYGIVQPGNDGTGDMGVLRPVDIVDGKLTMSSIKYIDRSIGEGFKKTELDGDELLITVRGTTGITALTDGRFAGMNVTRGIAVIRYNRKKINPLYLNAYFNTDESQRYIQEHTRGATLQQINLSDLRIQRIMLPPLSLQNQFAAFVAEVDKSKVEVQKALDQTQLLFDSLMQQYFG